MPVCPVRGQGLEGLRFSAVVESIGENRRISVYRNAENSTVFPIPVRLWNFFSVLRRLGGLELVTAQGDDRFSEVMM